MSRLCLALLADDSEKVEAFHELDMSFAQAFNEQFEKSSESIPFVEDIYKEEFSNMASYAVLNNLVTTNNDEEFQVDRTLLINILNELFWGKKNEKPNLPSLRDSTKP